MANGLTRWNPFREMQTMQNVMDRFFEDWRPLMDEFPRMGNALALDGCTARTVLALHSLG
jgi:hypothetical protein